MFGEEMEEVKLVDRTLGPFSAGDEVELWKWDAEVLEKHSLVVPSKLFSVQDMRKLALLQERSQSPITLPADFYSIALDSFRDILSSEGRKAADEMKSALMSLVEIRIPKLVLLSVSSGSGFNLPPEEMVLINRISEEVDEWSRKFLNELKKIGEEVEKGGSGGTVPRNSTDEADI
ncbi:MAG: hypothetical protein QXG10_01095 [Candidatus Hadarchaeales archaeon]